LKHWSSCENKSGFRAVVVPLLLALVAYAYFASPSVYSEPSASGATIHCEVLHDSPSDVERIEIREATTGELVWRVKAIGDKFQLHRFDVVRGWNLTSLQPSSGQFQTGIPQRERLYPRPGIRYRVSVCSPAWRSLCRTTTFML